MLGLETLIPLVLFIAIAAISTLSLIAGIILDHRGPRTIDGFELKMLGGVFLVIGCIGLSMSIWFRVDSKQEYNEHVCDIISIRNESNVEGSFALGYGSIEGRTYYIYYYETDKGIKQDRVKTDYTYIVETNEITPSLYHVKEKFEHDYYNIYVPEGTLICEFVLR